MGVLDYLAPTLFPVYDAEITFRDRIIGGVPKDPKILINWLRAKLRGGGTEAEQAYLINVIREHLVERGMDVDSVLTFEDASAAVESFAGDKHTNGFREDAGGLYIESRQIKSMLRESVNILYAGHRGALGKTINPTTKGISAFFRERVFIDPSYQVYLGVGQPTGAELMIQHVDTPKGPRSSLQYVEYVTRPVIRFTVKVLEDCLPLEFWARAWSHAQENGLGAMRSQGFGRFDLTCWQPRHAPEEK